VTNTNSGVRALLNDKLGRLREFLNRPGVIEVVLNEPGVVFVETAQGWVRALASSNFREKNTEAALGDAFSKVRDVPLDYWSAAILVPVFADVGISDAGVLRLVGHVPIRPVEMTFQLVFAPQDGGVAHRRPWYWRAKRRGSACNGSDAAATGETAVGCGTGFERAGGSEAGGKKIGRPRRH
jgi:hypothetical protein